MLCYQDKWFCEHYRSCTKGAECHRALTPEVEKKAEEADLPIAQMEWSNEKTGRPPCHEMKRKQS